MEKPGGGGGWWWQEEISQALNVILQDAYSQSSESLQSTL